MEIIFNFREIIVCFGVSEMTTNPDNVIVTIGSSIVISVLVNHEGKTEKIQWVEFQEVAMKGAIAPWILRDSWLGMFLCSKNMSIVYKSSFNVVLPKHPECCEIFNSNAPMIKENEHSIQVISVVDG